MTTPLVPVLTLPELIGTFSHPHAPLELGVAGACLALAWVMVRLWRGSVIPESSIWFGERIIDGVLFPVLALALAFGARHGLAAAGFTATVFRLIIPVLVSFALIRLSVRVLSAAFPGSRLVGAAERTISWLAWLAVVGWITGVLPNLLDDLDQIQWDLGNTRISVRKIIEGSLSAGFVLMLTLWISSAIEGRLLKGAVGEQLSLRKAAANAVRAVLTFFGLLLALSAVGIDLTALSVMGGAVGVGIGFGLQKLAANYVSGFVILAERSLRIGDVVKIDQFEGRITDITTRYTVIRSYTGREAIVPNEMLITSPVENLSLSDKTSLVTSTVSVAYGTDLSLLLPKLSAAVAGIERVLNVPEPTALLQGFGADGLDLLICFWISDPENGTNSVRSVVNLAILDVLNREGVDIPYPQRVVHLLSPAPAGIALTS